MLALFAVFAIELERPFTAFAVDHFKLLDVQVGDQRHSGRIMIHDDQSCWLLKRDGRLQEIAVEEVTEFVERGDRFKSLTQIELKNQLRSEFGKSFEVFTTQHYVVAARTGDAGHYAGVFEQIYRDFVRSFRTRGLHVDEPEFPLIAIVFPDQTGFVNYCRTERTPVQPGLLGYYLPSSNRVAMYQRPNSLDVDSVVIHEATHQIAFNTGVHSRLADHPKWVVEGLATVFESDGVRIRTSSNRPAERVNRERYLWFLEYSKLRRSANTLTSLISENRLFETAVLDAYSEAWALSFFLLETRPADYARYLKVLAEREPLKTYDSPSRLKDFTEVFGSDFGELDTRLLRFIRRIAER